MSARPVSTAAPREGGSPRFDRTFIEDHNLIERYLTNQLPVKGARDLENWCRANPEYLNELKLSERAQSSLKLLEASGRPQDLAEPKPPWWKSVYLLMGLGALAFFSLFAFWALFAKYELTRMQLDDARTVATQGTLVQPAVESTQLVTPDHAQGIDQARVVVSRNAPQLMDVHINLKYTDKLTLFRLFVDKKDQGRALVLNDLMKDSNGELRMTLNSTGLAPGIYNVRIEGMPFRGSGSPIPVGWLILDVR